jgi:hypothetical protein
MAAPTPCPEVVSPVILNSIIVKRRKTFITGNATSVEEKNEVMFLMDCKLLPSL